MSNGTFDFNVFLKETKETLLNPKSYFSTLKTDGGIAEPLIKAVVYGTIAGIILLLWGILNIGVAGGGMLGSAVGFMSFIWAVIAAVIGLFLGAVVTLIISSVCKGNSDFEANLRVTASVMAVMPISIFLRFTMWVNLYLGGLVSIAVYAYTMWLLYHGLVQTLKCEEKTTKTVCYVLVGIAALFTLIGLFAGPRMI
jgi:hypothetical protein